MKNKIKISVAVITYNQQDTIAQTLDSILCQHGNFDLELVIGEDCSTDNTYAICQEYAERYSDIVRLLPNTHNLGIMANFTRTMRACSGDYVGICAGDDYWCDEHKLQKQLDYFSIHTEVGVVSTSGYKLLVRTNELVPNAIAPFNPIENGNIKPFYFSPTYKGGVYAMPLSLLIKREVLQYVDFDEFVKRQFPVEDYPMQAVLAQHCKWGHIADMTVVYRVYKESATFISYDHPKYMQYHRGLMEIHRYLRDKFALQLFNYSEDYIQEYLFYREYLLYVFQGEYRKAKTLAIACNINTPKVKQAKKMTSNWLVFTMFRWYKKRGLSKDFKNRS